MPTYLYVVGLSLASVPILVAAGKWLYRRIRTHAQSDMMDQVKNSFMSEIATNHLPHLYSADEKVAAGVNALLEQMGSEHRIVLDDPPPIRWLPFEPKDGK